jgi:GNAT superfamily N-acetyltransferase
MDGMRIRDPEPGDIPALAGLLASLEAAAWSRGKDELEVESVLTACLYGKTASAYLRVAEAEGKLAGYASAHWLPNLILGGTEGYISELFVAPASRGQGIGAALLGDLEAEARARGCVRLSLLNLRERESYRRGFYAKRGWTERPGAANLIKRLEP